MNMNNYEKNSTNDSLKLIASQIAELNACLKTISMRAEQNTLFPSERCRYMYGTELLKPVDPQGYLKYISFLNAANEVLQEMGIHTSNTGYGLIIQAIQAYIDFGTFNVMLIKELYAAIGKYNGVTNIKCIQHNIDNAINAAYRDYLIDPMVNKMGVFGGKPKTKAFLIHVTREVCIRMQEDSPKDIR